MDEHQKRQALGVVGADCAVGWALVKSCHLKHSEVAQGLAMLVFVHDLW